MIEYKMNSCKHDIKKFIQEIVINEFKIDYWDEWFKEQNYDVLQVMPNVLFSAEDGDQLVGICSVKQINEQECYFNSLYVKKEYRNEGIGKKLFQMCLEYAKNNNYKKIVLSVDPNFIQAIHIYEKNGFIFDHDAQDGKELWYYKNM